TFSGKLRQGYGAINGLLAPELRQEPTRIQLALMTVPKPSANAGRTRMVTFRVRATSDALAWSTLAPLAARSHAWSWVRDSQRPEDRGRLNRPDGAVTKPIVTREQLRGRDHRRGPAGGVDRRRDQRDGHHLARGDVAVDQVRGHLSRRADLPVECVGHAGRRRHDHDDVHVVGPGNLLADGVALLGVIDARPAELPDLSVTHDLPLRITTTGPELIEGKLRTL